MGHPFIFYDLKLSVRDCESRVLARSVRAGTVADGGWVHCPTEVLQLGGNGRKKNLGEGDSISNIGSVVNV